MVQFRGKETPRPLVLDCQHVVHPVVRLPGQPQGVAPTSSSRIDPNIGTLVLAISRRPDSTTRSPLYPLSPWGRAGVRGAFFVGFAGLINVGMVLIAQGLARQSHDSTKEPHVSGCAGVFYGSDTFSHVYESFVLTQT